MVRRGMPASGDGRYVVDLRRYPEGCVVQRVRRGTASGSSSRDFGSRSGQRRGAAGLLGSVGFLWSIGVPIRRRHRREFVSFGSPGDNPLEHIGQPGKRIDTLPMRSLFGDW
jgi:hypothetical protein